MAFIPDEAVDRMTELSAGGWRLYCFLARCRNQNTGRCCPSVTTTMDAIGVNRGSVYALRKELAEKKWAIFQGDKVAFLYAFNSPKNQTIDSETIRDKSKSLKNQTLSEKSEKSDSESLKNQTTDDVNIEDNVNRLITRVDYQTQSTNNQTVRIENKEFNCELEEEKGTVKVILESLKNQTFQSEKSDSHIRKNQQREPAKRERGKLAPPEPLSPPFASPETEPIPAWPEIRTALCEICRLDREMISSLTYSELITTENKLVAAGHSAADLREFGRRWYEQDWRGKKGDPPRFNQIGDEWGRLMGANGHHKKKARSTCGQCNHGWLPPTEPGGYAKQCPCVNPSKEAIQ